MYAFDLIKIYLSAPYGFSPSVRQSVCLSVILEIHDYTVQHIDLSFALYYRAMLDAHSLSAVAELLVWFAELWQ